ncbi:fic/DOC family protein [Colletotrichum limetticola]|uniref:Fic/DOC family protein n=1 Tax=Colletotrichum limetticola TaxID=1209924 RepID=A0ABQ9Q513_9PEZI|nr:fic/DOC family protein [Colletotrichum limetticola]
MMSNRILSSTQQARLALLKKIFKPAAHLQKGTIEYERLARSGRVWEDYFMPGNSLKMGVAGVIESATHELQNYIIASQWVAENAAAKAGIAGLCEVEVRDLAVVSVVNTDSESAYDTWRTDSKKAGGNLVWGSKVPLGEYRNLPISVRSNRLRIFPYLQEVPACMERFFQYRDLQHREKALHPLILACQMTAYFVLVHPFPDGNGRTSRMVKQDYLARQGYSPVVTRDLKREDYLRMIDGAGQGKPEEFVIAVLEAQLAVLHQASTRLKM